jgi:tryptophan halogenase
MYNIIVVGGGTAGLMAASFLKTKYGPHVNVTVIYDHKNPGIGVGESLTPLIYGYLKYVGIIREELIANVNATVKLGLKFKNWLNDGSYYWHAFQQKDLSGHNLDALFDLANNTYDSDSGYSSYFLESNRIPDDPEALQSLHIDAVLFARYIEHKFKDKLNIIDGIVEQVQVENRNIKKVTLQDGREIQGDFFVDASGMQYALFKHLDVEWEDRKDWLPIDRCIPNPITWNFTTQPTYTTSEASQDGWILQVPLSNRWGTGYLYSSQFQSDSLAQDNFDQFLKKNYNSDLESAKVLKFNSGFWKEQWVGNCIAVGLSSGFSEPLEATNIHHVVHQLWMFVDMFNLEIFEYDRKKYNKIMTSFYNNVYLYLRFCYTTGRTDSEFWKYMTHNVPEPVKELEERISRFSMNEHSLPGLVFAYHNFTRVAHGLGKIQRNSYINELRLKNQYETARLTATKLKIEKMIDYEKSIDHYSFIQNILNNGP